MRPEPRAFLSRAALAAVPALLAAALIYPGTFDPIAPFSEMPAPVATLLAFALSALAAGFAGSTRLPPEDRARWRRETIAPVLFGAAASVALSLSTAGPLLVGGGARTILALSAIAAAPAATAVTLLVPRVSTRIALLVSVAAAVIFSRAAHGGPLESDALLRAAMVSTPGWGASSLGALERRALFRAAELPAYPALLEAQQKAIAERMGSNAIRPEWLDDAHLVRSWLLVKEAAAPGLPDDHARALLRDAVREDLAFAEDPDAQAEPFTAQGILYLDALRLADVGAAEALRIRIATTWSALELCTERVDDRESETRATALLRRLFEERHLDLTHPLYLESYLIEARRRVEAGDAAGYLALFDGLAARPFPPELSRRFAERSEWLRAHADDGYEPAMLYLRGELEGNLDHDPRPFYRQIVEKYPTASVTSAAKAALTRAPGGRP